MGCDLNKDDFVKVINAKQFKKQDNKTIDIYERNIDRFSKNGYDYTRRYAFAGYGMDAQFIYKVLETKYNIAKGIIYNNKVVGYCTRDKKEYKGFMR